MSDSLDVSLNNALMALYREVKASNDAGKDFGLEPLFEHELFAIEQKLSPDLATQAETQEVTLARVAAPGCNLDLEHLRHANNADTESLCETRSRSAGTNGDDQRVALYDLHTSPIGGLSWSDVDRLAEACTSDACGINVRVFAVKVAAACKIEARSTTTATEHTEAERYRKGMENWKATAEAKDAKVAPFIQAVKDAQAAMERAKAVPVWDDLPHALHVELDTIFAAISMNKPADCNTSGRRGIKP